LCAWRYSCCSAAETVPPPELEASPLEPLSTKLAEDGASAALVAGAAVVLGASVVVFGASVVVGAGGGAEDVFGVSFGELELKLEELDDGSSAVDDKADVVAWLVLTGVDDVLLVVAGTNEEADEDEATEEDELLETEEESWILMEDDDSDELIAFEETAAIDVGTGATFCTALDEVALAEGELL
jgi:hypothetical protein